MSIKSTPAAVPQPHARQPLACKFTLLRSSWFRWVEPQSQGPLTTERLELDNHTHDTADVHRDFL